MYSSWCTTVVVLRSVCACCGGVTTYVLDLLEASPSGVWWFQVYLEWLKEPFHRSVAKMGTVAEVSGQRIVVGGESCRLDDGSS